MRFIYFLAAILLVVAPARAEDSPEGMQMAINIVMKSPLKSDSVVYWALKCKSPCDLEPKYAAGGAESEYRAAAYILVRDKKDLEIKYLTACRSSCTILMDIVADNKRRTCVGYDMAWAVHYGTVRQNGVRVKSADFLQHEYRAPLIRDWIKEHGMREDLRYSYVPAEIVEQAYGLCPNTMP